MFVACCVKYNCFTNSLLGPPRELINIMISNLEFKRHQLRFSELRNSIFQSGRHQAEASRMEPRVSVPRRTSEREIKPLDRSYPNDKLTRVSLWKARFPTLGSGCGAPPCCSSSVPLASRGKPNEAVHVMRS